MPLNLRLLSSGCAVLAAIGLAAGAAAAHAVCLNENGVSGYQQPIEQETRDSVGIVAARVTGSVALQEDPAYPEGVTARLFQLQVDEVFKGRIPRRIEIREENDAGRFGLEVGAGYLLFLRPVTRGLSSDRIVPLFWVSPCGHSGLLGDRAEHLARLRKELRSEP